MASLGYTVLKSWLDDFRHLPTSLMWCEVTVLPKKYAPVCAWLYISVSVYWLIFNSLALGKYAWNFKQVIFKQILVIDGWGLSCEIALIWMSLDFTDDQSTLVQVMAWCRQATSHYLSQCWPRSLSPYGVTRPQWVNHILQDYFTGTGAIIWTTKQHTTKP